MRSHSSESTFPLQSRELGLLNVKAKAKSYCEVQLPREKAATSAKFAANFYTRSCLLIPIYITDDQPSLEYIMRFQNYFLQYKSLNAIRYNSTITDTLYVNLCNAFHRKKLQFDSDYVQTSNRFTEHSVPT